MIADDLEIPGHVSIFRLRAPSEIRMPEAQSQPKEPFPYQPKRKEIPKRSKYFYFCFLISSQNLAWIPPPPPRRFQPALAIRSFDIVLLFLSTVRAGHLSSFRFALWTVDRFFLAKIYNLFTWFDCFSKLMIGFAGVGATSPFFFIFFLMLGVVLGRMLLKLCGKDPTFLYLL